MSMLNQLWRNTSNDRLVQIARVPKYLPCIPTLSCKCSKWSTTIWIRYDIISISVEEDVGVLRFRMTYPSVLVLRGIPRKGYNNFHGAVQFNDQIYNQITNSASYKYPGQSPSTEACPGWNSRFIANEAIKRLYLSYKVARVSVGGLCWWLCVGACDLYYIYRNRLNRTGRIEH